MTASQKRVVVVGGGIAGLTAAYRLSRSAQAPEVVLVEADQRLGGKILTEHVNGFVMDAGPESMITTRPHALALATELGLADRLCAANETNRGTFVLSGGSLHALPEGMTGLVPGRVGPVVRSRLLSPFGKCRMAWEYVVPARLGEEDESVKSFVTRRLGREAYQRLVEPLVGGIFSADPARLSLLATMPQLRASELDHGGLIRAMLDKRREARSHESVSGGRDQLASAPVAVTLRGGMGELVRTLAQQLGDVQVRLASTVAELERRDGHYLVHVHRRDGEPQTLQADSLVLAVPSTAAADMAAHLDPELAVAMRAAEYTSTVTVSMGFRAGDVAHRIRGHGYLVPAREGRAARACTWTSTKFPGHAPEGHALVRVSLGGPGRPSLTDSPDETLIDLARGELLATVGLSADPVASLVHRWHNVIPVYTVGHRERLIMLNRLTSQLPGLTLAGSGFHGASVPDCVASGDAAARRVLSHLERLTRA